jgi:hypothetical protein
MKKKTKKEALTETTKKAAKTVAKKAPDASSKPPAKKAKIANKEPRKPTAPNIITGAEAATLKMRIYR